MQTGSKNNKLFNVYDPIYNRLPKPLDEKYLTYYELRLWINHKKVNEYAYKTLKEARKAYKDLRFDELENEGRAYAEIIYIKPLKKP